MDLGIVSAVLLANGAALPASDAAQAVAASDERVLALPGEAPLGVPEDAPFPQEVPAAPPPANTEEQGVDDGSVIVVTGQDSIPGDPMAALNAETYEVMQEVDQAIVEPVAFAYRDELPKPIRKSLRNFFRNLREPVVFLNFLLQLKPGKAMETLGRFVINSTIGIGGLVDQAKGPVFNLPRRENGFANTLGYYGVKPGAFLYLPLIGATTVRDLVGSLADAAVLPTAIGRPFNRFEYGVSAYVVTGLESRIEFDDELEAIRNSDEPYTSMREAYLARRAREIAALRGEVPEAEPETVEAELPEPVAEPAAEVEAEPPPPQADATSIASPPLAIDL